MECAWAVSCVVLCLVVCVVCAVVCDLWFFVWCTLFISVVWSVCMWCAYFVVLRRTETCAKLRCSCSVCFFGCVGADEIDILQRDVDSLLELELNIFFQKSL